MAGIVIPLTKIECVRAGRNWHNENYLDFLNNSEGVPKNYDEHWDHAAYVAQEPLPQDGAVPVLPVSRVVGVDFPENILRMHPYRKPHIPFWVQPVETLLVYRMAYNRTG